MGRSILNLVEVLIMESWKEELYHHGIKGQKWGVRRFQNEDGSLTSQGKQRYSANEDYKSAKKEYKQAQKDYRKVNKGIKNQFGMGMVRNRHNVEAAEKKVNESYDKLADARINKAAVKGERAEKRAYVKEAFKVGMPGSYKDKTTSGAGSRLYDRTIQRKGQDYADSIMKSTKNTAIAAIVASTAISLGSSFVLGYLNNKYY